MVVVKDESRARALGIYRYDKSKLWTVELDTARSGGSEVMLGKEWRNGETEGSETVVEGVPA